MRICIGFICKHLFNKGSASTSLRWGSFGFMIYRCVYVYLYVYMYMCMYVCMYVCVHGCVAYRYTEGSATILFWLGP